MPPTAVATEIRVQQPRLDFKKNGSRFPKCLRCGGQVVLNYHSLECIQCSCEYKLNGEMVTQIMAITSVSREGNHQRHI